MGVRRWWLLVLLLPEFLNCSRMSSSLYLGKWGFGEPPGSGECGEEEADFLLATSEPPSAAAEPPPPPGSDREEGEAEGRRERW